MAALLQSTNITSVNTDVLLYQVPPGKTASFSLNLCNRNDTKVKVSLALTTASSPVIADYIEYNAEILPNDTLQRLGLVLGSASNVFIKTDTAGISAVIWGFVETPAGESSGGSGGDSGGSGGSSEPSIYPIVEVPYGTINGSNTTFSISVVPPHALGLYLNGLRLVNGIGYTLTGSTITMVTVPNPGDTLIAEIA